MAALDAVTVILWIAAHCILSLWRRRRPSPRRRRSWS